MNTNKPTEKEISRMSLDKARSTLQQCTAYIGTEEWDYEEIIDNLLLRIAALDPDGVINDVSDALTILDEKMSSTDYQDNIDYGFDWENQLTATFIYSYTNEVADEEKILELLEANPELKNRIFCQSHYIPYNIITHTYNYCEPEFFGSYLDMAFSNTAFLYKDRDDDWFNITDLLDWFVNAQPYKEQSVETLRQKVHNLPEEMRDDMDAHLEDVLKQQAELYKDEEAYYSSYLEEPNDVSDTSPIDIPITLDISLSDEAVEELTEIITAAALESMGIDSDEDYGEFTDEYGDPYYDPDDEYSESDELGDEFRDEDDDWDDDPWKEDDEDEDSDESSDQLAAADQSSKEDDDFEDFMLMTAALTLARGENPLDPGAMWRTMTDPLGLFHNKKKK